MKAQSIMQRYRTKPEYCSAARRMRIVFLAVLFQHRNLSPNLRYLWR